MDSHTYDDEGSTMNVPKFSRVFTESEYEEIGPPRHRPGGVQHPCDLCGSPNALLSCAQCHNQAFCAACDDMYHKHPKRTDHVRKVTFSLFNYVSALKPYFLRNHLN
ncbi:E3 ubiquitin-protein ligase RNF31 [Eurytemora carolleeae]|uniref:E3 ubiquitin-protein ligase RNF31 n=1 Tax=Eurytemora carolleeae TaxID=1294199 RepID=UPI000C771C78|nr:E3 ubiquitin-protein ligase RNF31 [Eurytemora carolleeae]|eukprot:XP_023337098.1 E3 ubiquitin-protein ligase RNF31-like [Eurytemora affinis]